MYFQLEILSYLELHTHARIRTRTRTHTRTHAHTYLASKVIKDGHKLLLIKECFQSELSHIL